MVGLLAAAPAGATVVDRGPYTDSYSFEYDDCGFDVLVEGTVSGHFRMRAGKGKTDTAFFLNDTHSYTETHTNPATGATLTITGHAVFNEIKATRVEGNIFEFEAVEAGQPLRMYDWPATSYCETEAPSTTTPCSTQRATTFRAGNSSQTCPPTCTARTPGSTHSRSARPSRR